jgi:hypothetical protein
MPLHPPATRPPGPPAPRLLPKTPQTIPQRRPRQHSEARQLCPRARRPPRRAGARLCAANPRAAARGPGRAPGPGPQTHPCGGAAACAPTATAIPLAPTNPRIQAPASRRAWPRRARPQGRPGAPAPPPPERASRLAPFLTAPVGARLFFPSRLKARRQQLRAPPPPGGGLARSYARRAARPGRPSTGALGARARRCTRAQRRRAAPRRASRSLQRSRVRCPPPFAPAGGGPAPRLACTGPAAPTPPPRLLHTPAARPQPFRAASAPARPCITPPAPPRLAAHGQGPGRLAALPVERLRGARPRPAASRGAGKTPRGTTAPFALRAGPHSPAPPLATARGRLRV